MIIDIGSKVNLLYSKEINQARINTIWGIYSLTVIEIFIGLLEDYGEMVSDFLLK
jgi:hypothetical protein